MMNYLNKKRKAFTMVEVIFTMGIFVLLSGSVYQIFKSFNQSFLHSQNKLDILQTTRIIMSGLRNELRNAAAKPELRNGMLNIPMSATKTMVYFYDQESRRMYRGEKGAIDEPEPDISEMKQFLFDDGQILSFEYDFSYRDANSFVESELTLNAQVWVKVTMKILYSEKFNKLSEEDKAKILENPDDDPRVKTLFMVITPRKVNWVLQATQ